MLNWNGRGQIIPCVLWVATLSCCANRDAIGEQILEPGTRLVERAQTALDARRYSECWRLLDLANSNYPQTRNAVRGLIRRLDERVGECGVLGRVAVKTWPDGKLGALSLTYDDGLDSSITHAVPEMTARDVGGTFYLIQNRVCRTAVWRDLLPLGHEIGNHTVSHVELPAQCELRIHQELEDCSEFLATEIVGQSPRTFAYPFTIAGERDGPLRRIVRQQFLAARAGERIPLAPATPDQFDLISARILTATTTSAELERDLQTTLATNGWLSLSFHAIIDADGWEPLSEERWNEILQLLDNYSDKFWIAPTGRVASFVKLRRDVYVTSSCLNGDTICVCLTPPSGSTELATLEVSVRTPANWIYATLDCSGVRLPVRNGMVDVAIPVDARGHRISRIP